MTCYECGCFSQRSLCIPCSDKSRLTDRTKIIPNRNVAYSIDSKLGRHAGVEKMDKDNTIYISIPNRYYYGSVIVIKAFATGYEIHQSLHHISRDKDDLLIIPITMQKEDMTEYEITS